MKLDEAKAEVARRLALKRAERENTTWVKTVPDPDQSGVFAIMPSTTGVMVRGLTYAQLKQYESSCEAWFESYESFVEAGGELVKLATVNYSNTET